MASGYAILSGLLQGLGAGGEEVVQARRQALAEEKLKQDAAESALRNALLNKQLEQQQSQFDAQQADKYASGSDVASAFRLAGLQPPADEMGPSRTLASTLPGIITAATARGTQQRDERVRQDQARLLMEQGAGRPAVTTEPAQLMGQLAPGEDPEAAAMIPRTPGEVQPAVAGDPYLALLGQLKMKGPVTADETAALKDRFGREKYVGLADGRVLNTTTGEISGDTTREPKPQNTTTREVNTAQGAYVITTDPNGKELNRVRVGDMPPHPPREPAQPNATQSMIDLTRQKQALIGQGIPATDPRVRNLNEQIDNIKSYTLAPGGQVIGAGSGDPRATAPMQPSGGERSEMADLRAGIAGVDNLLNNVDKNKDVLGNFASNPVGAFRRGASTFVPGMTTAAEKQFLADLATQVAEIKRATIGATQTDTELKGLVDSLPDKGQVDISVIPRLQAIKAKLNRKLTEREAVFAPSGGPQQGGGGWGKARVVNP